MDKLPAIGTEVRLINGRSNKAAKVIGHLDDIEGGIRLDQRLDGFQYWNMLDVEPVVRPTVGIERKMIDQIFWWVGDLWNRSRRGCRWRAVAARGLHLEVRLGFRCLPPRDRGGASPRRKAHSEQGEAVNRRNFVKFAAAAPLVATSAAQAAAAFSAPIKVFKLNDWEWWAAASLAEAVAHWKEWTGLTDEELDDPRELSADEMEKLTYVEVDDNMRESTFAAELKARIDAGVEFPQPFATTEY